MTNGYQSLTLNPAAISRNIMIHALSFLFYGVATGFSKASVGLFLLRLALERWQRILIWTDIAFSTIATLRELVCSKDAQTGCEI